MERERLVMLGQKKLCELKRLMLPIILIFESFPCRREAHDMLYFGRLNTNPGHGLLDLVQRLPTHKRCRIKKAMQIV